MRYQLRIPRETELDTVLSLIVEKAWTAIEPHFDLRRLQSDDFEDFRSVVKQALSPYVCAFDLCGTSVECSDEIEGAPLVDREDYIYHLILPETFSELVSGLSSSALHSIKHIVTAGEEEFVRSALEVAFRHGLSQNLYYNPLCGRIDLCNESRAIDPFEDR